MVVTENKVAVTFEASFDIHILSLLSCSVFPLKILLSLISVTCAP